MPFLSRAVAEERHAHLREMLADQGCEALIVSNPDHFFFLTNYLLDVAPWERPVAAILPKSGPIRLLLNELSTHHVDMARERGTLWADDVWLYSEHPRSTDRLPVLPQFPELLAAALRDRGIRKGRIAVDSAGGHFARIPALLPGTELVGVEAHLREARWVKTAEELALMRQCAALTDWGQARYREEVRPGRLVADVDLEIARRCAIEGAERFPGQQLELRVRSSAGPASAAPHGSGADASARFEAGQGIVNILVFRLNGMTVENERTWLLGRCSDTHVRALEAAIAAQEAAIAKLVAGTALFEVDAAAQAVIEKAGYAEHIRHRTGHGMGTAGHEFPEDMPWSPRRLRENEVYSAEPGIYLYGVGGFRHDDTVAVGRAAPEVITRAPKSVPEVTIPAG